MNELGKLGPMEFFAIVIFGSAAITLGIRFLMWVGEVFDSVMKTMAGNDDGKW